ncbi:MAG TPA: hypothetical protein V6D33_11505, partial [Cyanophyceae cyanobacterium]
MGNGYQLLIEHLKLRASRRILGLLLLALLGLATALTIPALSAQQIERTAETIPPVANTQSLLQQGIELYQSERFSEAAAIWQQANSAFVSQGNNLGQALVLSNLSVTYLQLGQWEEAQNFIDQSLNLLQTSNDSANSPTYQEILAKALNAQGNLQWEKGQLEQSLSTWKDATRHYAEAGHSEGIVITKINQSKALQALGLSRQAEEVLQQVYQNLQQQSDSELRATGLRYLGTALRRIGKLEESQQILAESLNLTDRSKTESLTLLELGNTERALGNRDTDIGKEDEAQRHNQSAIQFYQQAADLGTGTENIGVGVGRGTLPLRDGQLEAQLNLLSLLVETGQHSEAMQLWPRIQDAIANLPPSRTAIYARLNLARSLTCLQPGIDKTALLCRGNEQPSEIATPSWQAIAQIVATASQQAQRLQDPRAESYALGQLGGLYEL